jgi:hypothetical protein
MAPREEIADGTQHGNLIVNALDAYYEEHGAYPLTLDELVPAYISKIPVVITGQEYEYKLLEPDNVWGEPYHLTFYLKTEKNVGCSYMQRLNDWDCGQDFTH